MSKVVVQTELDALTEILANNSNKNFVQRIINMPNYPVLEGEEEGVVHTHLMADAEADGRYFAYPTVFMELDGRLNKIDNPDKAFRHAIDTGEYIEFPTQTSASWFAENYKKFWDKMGYEH